MDIAELQADLRRANELLRATERDRDNWKERAAASEKLLGIANQRAARFEFECGTLRTLVDQTKAKITDMCEGLREVAERYTA